MIGLDGIPSFSLKKVWKRLLSILKTAIYYWWFWVEQAASWMNGDSTKVKA
jgi:hypothetical protein